MRVHVHPADEGGCGHYRMRWPAEALAAEGHDVHLHEGLPAQWVDTPDGPRVVGCEPVDCDVVVFQRPLQRALADVIPHLQAQGVAVVVEIDDDFSAVPIRNVSFHHVHPKLSPDRNFQHLQRACAQADLVTCTTPALARRYAKHGRVRVLPNCVPRRYLDIQPVDSLSVGWSGSVDTHPDDLEVTRGAIGRVCADIGVPFRVVGTGKGVRERLGLRDPVEACGWVPIDDYPAKVAELGVGIVPLSQSKFNQAKSWLKGLEMAAVGVPFVAAPTEDYRRLHAEGAGWLAERPRQWEHLVRLLLANGGAREELAALGRQTAGRWTVEANAWRWWEAWTDAHEYGRAAA